MPNKPNGRLGRLADRATGRTDAKIADAEAVLFAPAEVVLVRHRPDKFTLCVRLGEQWHAVSTVEASDPALKRLREDGAVIDYPPNATVARHRREAAHRRNDAPLGTGYVAPGHDARADHRPSPAAPDLAVV